jgi:predicted transcriptional regulator
MKKGADNRSILSLTDYKILICLIENKDLNCREVSEKIKISQSKTGKRLIHLKEIGLIKQDGGVGINGIKNNICASKIKIKNFLELIDKKFL